MNFISKIYDDDPTDAIGWIGGYPPAILTDKLSTFEDYRFYLTIQKKENPEKYLSIFVHHDFNTRIDHQVFPDIAIQVIEHDASPEGDAVTFLLPDLCKSYLSLFQRVHQSQFNFITYSEQPKLIQEEAYYFEHLQQNYEFYLQIDEDYYLDSTLQGSYIFAYGALYLFQHKHTHQIIAGFWQH